MFTVDTGIERAHARTRARERVKRSETSTAEVTFQCFWFVPEANVTTRATPAHTHALASALHMLAQVDEVKCAAAPRALGARSVGTHAPIGLEMLFYALVANVLGAGWLSEILMSQRMRSCST